MPHAPRKKSESGFHHVVTKGADGQIIFENDDDRRFYLQTLEASLEGQRVEIHAYCLMGNHVHLLVKDPNDQLGSFMKRLDETYAMYFSKKTGRAGHVFSGRFWSEPLETDERFIATLRYIHANPEPAGLGSAKSYPWSSYKAYTGKKSFVKTEYALELLGGAAAFKEAQNAGIVSAVPFKGSTLHRHHTSDEIAALAVALIGRDALNNIRTMKPHDRADLLAKLVDAGFTDAEIGRVTGLGKSSLHRELH